VNVKIGGTYRNRLGAIMVIDQFEMKPGGYMTLGDTYLAHSPDDLFGPQYYIVTSKSLEEAGYALVEEES